MQVLINEELKRGIDKRGFRTSIFDFKNNDLKRVKLNLDFSINRNRM